MNDLMRRNHENTLTLLGEALKPAPVMDGATLDAVEAVIIRRRGLTRHTGDAKLVSLVLADVQKLRPTPDGDAA